MLVSVHTTQIWSIHSMHATKSRGFVNDGISPYPIFPFRLYLEYYCFIFIKHLWYESVCQCIIIFVCIAWIHLFLFCCNYNHIFLVCMAQRHCFMPVINLSILLNGIRRDYGYILWKMISTYQAFNIHVEHLNSNFMYNLICFDIVWMIYCIFCGHNHWSKCDSNCNKSTIWAIELLFHTSIHIKTE